MQPLQRREVPRRQPLRGRRPPNCQLAQLAQRAQRRKVRDLRGDQPRLHDPAFAQVEGQVAVEVRIEPLQALDHRLHLRLGRQARHARGESLRGLAGRFRLAAGGRRALDRRGFGSRRLQRVFEPPPLRTRAGRGDGACVLFKERVDPPDARLALGLGEPFEERVVGLLGLAFGREFQAGLGARRGRVGLLARLRLDRSVRVLPFRERVARRHGLALAVGSLVGFHAAAREEPQAQHRQPDPQRDESQRQLVPARLGAIGPPDLPQARRRARRRNRCGTARPPRARRRWKPRARTGASRRGRHRVQPRRRRAAVRRGRRGAALRAPRRVALDQRAP
ncbi:MAG: hypothetical protein M5U26_19010 [Planctomycetota bacterium]|nr:hypothetical protein [Planctomycetota bacterium]